MTYGLTISGLVVPTLQDLKLEMETDLRSGLGNGINLLPTELLGQIVGILSYRRAQDFQTMQGIYNSQYPPTANGVSLDNVLALTAIRRLRPTRGTGSGVAYGTLGTIIPAGSVISVAGNPSARFLTVGPATIGAGTNEVQRVQFSSVPDAGSWTLLFNGSATGTLAFNDNAAAVQAALNALTGVTVTVTGNYTSGFTITFTGSSGSQPQTLLRNGVNTLTTTSVQVTVSITETTLGILPNVTIPLIAESAGEIPAYANTLTVIEATVSGWSNFNNPVDIVAGNDTETDAAARIRQRKTLATSGSTTVDAIRSHLLDLDDVTDARVFENDSDITDVSGRPPHSFEAVVQDGDAQTIADTIWEFKPAGIRSYGLVSRSVLDSMGFAHTVQFSRPIEVDIYIIIAITTDSTFPVGGNTAIREAVAALGTLEFGIGDDVITIRFYDAINSVQGVLTASILIGTIPVPVSSANITINDDQLAFFSTSRITVTP